MLTVDASVWVAAFDPRDRFHGASVAFLSAAAKDRLPLNGPAIVLLETACAIARLTRDAASSQAAESSLRAHPSLKLEPVSDELLRTAARLGTRAFLRGADALYAAAARLSGGTLVSWDDEMIRRAGAVTPEQWLTSHSAG